LRGVDVPALILCGRDDMLCPVSRHELMAELIPDARLEIIEGAGHLPTLEQPELTNAVFGPLAGGLNERKSIEITTESRYANRL